ncbi:MAG: NrfD/PsrC family molybdoenzyme membrane anchor subunit [Myxococcota bacterium]
MNQDVVEIISGRANADIDPHLHIWGWEISAYLFVGGLVAGVMVLLAALELARKAAPDDATAPPAPRSAATQLMPFWALGLLSLGMLFLFLDLAHPGHVYRFYTAFEPTSAMSWGAWILLLVYPTVALLGLSGLDAERRARLVAWAPVARLRLARLVGWLTRLGDRHRAKLVWAMLAIGVGLGTYTGLLLGTMAARPPWSSAVLGPLFLTSGVSTGAALLMLARPASAEIHRLVRWDTLAIVVELVLLTVMLLGFQSAGTPGKAAAATLLGGAYTAPFFALVVVTGLLVPLALNLLEVRRGLPGTVFAPALILVGGLALRAILVAAGQSIDFPAGI